MMNQIPISLYIHTPWCVKKCPYCDFNSHQLREAIPEENYLDRLVEDFEISLSAFHTENIEFISIFIGGGTPSLLPPQFYDKLLNAIQKKSHISSTTEITLEANPGTIDNKRFKDYYKVGINRLSIGCQSFQASHLMALGRIHGPQDCVRAIEIAKSAGFENYNIDLMFGLPNQTIKEAMHDLRTALSHQPTHLSWYQLTLEPNTLFHKNPPMLPEDETIFNIFQEGQKYLSQEGFHQYEVSAYCKNEKQCKHNRNYWQYGDYLGIGAGAHSKISHKNKIIRILKYKHPKIYLQKKNNYIAQQNEVLKSQIPFEFMLNALRLYEPIPFQLFEQRTRLKKEIILPILQKAKQRNLLIFDKNYFYPTLMGRLFLNDVVELFLPTKTE